jgi:hypothetical protein
MKDLRDSLRSPAFLDLIASLPGYSAAGAGQVVESFDSISTVPTA